MSYLLPTITENILPDAIYGIILPLKLLKNYQLLQTGSVKTKKSLFSLLMVKLRLHLPVQKPDNQVGGDSVYLLH